MENPRASTSSIDECMDKKNGDSVEMPEEANIASTSAQDSKIRKRRLSNNDNDSNSAVVATVKKFITKNDCNKPPPSLDQSEFNLLHFSDEILLEILKNLDTDTLRAINRTCTRFARLSEDRRLWKTFDLSKVRLRTKSIAKWLKYVSKDTKYFSIRGMVSKYPLDIWKNITLTSNTLYHLSTICPDLEELVIYEGYLNFQKIRISEIPNSIKRLTFNGCQTAQPIPANVFHKIDYYLEFLEVLSLEKCPWFETHDLIVFSKLPNLKKLILRGCSMLKECVPYGSIATRFGFRALESLDIRDTPVTDSDIQCFNITTTLRELLMECPEHLREPATAAATAADTESSDSEFEAEDEYKDTARDQNIIDDYLVSDGDSDDDDEMYDKKNGGVNKEGEGSRSSGSCSGSHVIQVILQNGILNQVRSLDNEYRIREINGVRYMVGVVNGGGPEEVLQRHLEQRRADQRMLELDRQSTRYALADVHTIPELKTSDESNRKQKPSVQEPSASTSGNKSAGEQSKVGNILDTKADNQKSENVDQEAGPSNKPTEPVKTIGCEEKPQATVSQAKDEENTQRTDDNNANNNNDARENPESPPPRQPNRQNAMQRYARQHRQGLIIIHQGGIIGDRIAPAVQNRLVGVDRQRLAQQQRDLQSRLAQHLHRLQQHPGVFEAASNLQLQSPVTDRGICSFGITRNNVNERIIWIRVESRPADTLIERLTIRHYRSVTDVALRHLTLSAPNLRYLDVTGTTVTRAGIRSFKAAKPDCVVVSDFNKRK